MVICLWTYKANLDVQRAGRVILDNPVDPAIYSREDPYRVRHLDQAIHSAATHYDDRRHGERIYSGQTRV